MIEIINAMIEMRILVVENGTLWQLKIGLS